MVIGILKEITIGENRVAVVPDAIPKLQGVSVALERGAGSAAGFPNAVYSELD
jgi:NAD(P) transhydrogenase subunit alpha|tara:strand:+ start:395 stop:553 length:159 start_codon:yes stop_codon:yes gene_type:complete